MSNKQKLYKAITRLKELEDLLNAVYGANQKLHQKIRRREDALRQSSITLNSTRDLLRLRLGPTSPLTEEVEQALIDNHKILSEK